MEFEPIATGCSAMDQRPTHDMEEAEQLCDRIGIIHNGEIVALDTPENLRKKVGARNMEEVFMAFTGMRFEDYETAEVV